MKIGGGFGIKMKGLEKEKSYLKLYRTLKFQPEIQY